MWVHLRLIFDDEMQKYQGVAMLSCSISVNVRHHGETLSRHRIVVNVIP